MGKLVTNSQLISAYIIAYNFIDNLYSPVSIKTGSSNSIYYCSNPVGWIQYKEASLLDLDLVPSMHKHTTIHSYISRGKVGLYH